MANAPLNLATLFTPKPVLAGLAGLSGVASALSSSAVASSASSTFLAFPWAARLHQRDAAGLWDLRLVPQIEAGLTGEYIWLRGPAWTEQAGAILRAIPTAHWYEAQPGGRLRELTRLLPTGRLPQVTWLPLLDAMIISPPATALPAHFSAETFQRVQLTLTRSTHEHVACLLLVDAPIWREYIEMEPEIRFQGLHFAVSADGRVCVGGKAQAQAAAVLPSLPGRRYWIQDGIAVPCGWTWSPELPAGIVRSALWTQHLDPQKLRSSPHAGAGSGASSPPPLPKSGSRPAGPPALPAQFGGAEPFGLRSGSSATSPSGSVSAAAKAPHPLASHGWLYLWHQDRTPEWIAAEELIPLSRSAARLSLGRL